MWLDLEMTDIRNVASGRIMEVGVIFTGPTFELLESFDLLDPSSAGVDGGRGAGPEPNCMYHRVVRLTREEIAASSPWSKSVHSAIRPHANQSLFEMCLTSPFSLGQVEEDLVRLVAGHSEGRPIMLAGSSIACDRVFIDHHMPKLSSLLHHRMIDVSTVLEMTRRMYPGFKPHIPRLRKTNHAHSAMADIVASLRLMHELQHTAFMPMIIETNRPYQARHPSSLRPGGQPRAAHHHHYAERREHEFSPHSMSYQQGYPVAHDAHDAHDAHAAHASHAAHAAHASHAAHAAPSSSWFHSAPLSHTSYSYARDHPPAPEMMMMTAHYSPISHSQGPSSVVRQSFRFPAHVFERYLGESRNPYASHG